MHKKIIISAFAIFTSVNLLSLSAHSSEPASTTKGKYLIEIAGCNDCHTSGYAQSGGTIPEAQWLAGDRLGFQGPWGTTYPVNLRQYMSEISEENWVTRAKTLKTRPPMPWWALNAMTEDDLKAIYKYVRGLGPVANSVPSYVPPGEQPKTAYIQWPGPPK